MGSAQAEPALGVLGVVEAGVGGEPVDIGHPRRRSVLAALLVDVNRVVPVDELVDRVWGEHPPARARRALEFHTRTGDRTGQGFDLTALGWYAACLGDHAGAPARCREAVALMDDRDGLAHCHRIMGCAHHHLGDHEESVAHHGRAVALFRLLGDRYREAWGLVLTGDAHRAAGREDRARATWTRAPAILDGLGHDDGAAIRERPARVPAAAGR